MSADRKRAGEAQPLNSRQLNSYVVLRIAYCGLVICDFILVDGYISGVGGPRVEPGAKRGGGPGGARAVFLIDPPTPFGVGGLNSIVLALVPYRHVSICS